MIDSKKILLFLLSCASSAPLFSAKKLNMRKIRRELSKLSAQERRQKIAELRARVRTEKKEEKKPKKLSQKELKRQAEIAARKKARQEEMARIAALTPTERAAFFAQQKKLKRKERIARALKRKKRAELINKVILIAGSTLALAGSAAAAVVLTRMSKARTRTDRITYTQRAIENLNATFSDAHKVNALREVRNQDLYARWNPTKQTMYTNCAGVAYLIERLRPHHWGNHDSYSTDGLNIDYDRVIEYLDEKALKFAQETFPVYNKKTGHYSSQQDDRLNALRVVHDLSVAPNRRSARQFQLDTARKKAANRRTFHEEQLIAEHGEAPTHHLPVNVGNLITSFLHPDGEVQTRKEVAYQDGQLKMKTKAGIQPLHHNQRPDTARGAEIMAELNRRIAEAEINGRAFAGVTATAGAQSGEDGQGGTLLD